jgi:hypothetical protein
MNVWIKGEKDREVFAMKAPKSTSIDRMGLPAAIAELPMPAILARQRGEAWTRPFVAVYEPSTIAEPKSIVSIHPFTPVKPSTDFQGLVIEGKSDDRQFVFSSSENMKEIIYGDKSFAGVYAVVAESKNDVQYLFLGNGTKIAKAGFGIVSTGTSTSAALENKNNEWFINCTQAVLITVPAAAFPGRTSIVVSGKTIAGKKSLLDGKALLSFNISACTRTKIIFK